MPEVVELYVVMYCEACAASVKKAVKKIPGVQSCRIDYNEQKVTVIGDVERGEVWRRIHKTGKRVTMIPKPAPAPPKEEPQEEKQKEITTVSETITEVIKVEEKKQDKSEETAKGVDTKEKVKAHETKEEVVTVVETHLEEEKGDEGQAVEGNLREELIRKQTARRREPDEWMPMFVSAPYYTLPSRFF